MGLEETIHQHLVKEELDCKILLDNCSAFELDQSKIEEACWDIEERFKVRLKSGVVSKTLKEQIARHRMNLGEIFDSKVEFYNASEIIDVIVLVDEGKLNGKKFKREILYGYSKIHHGTYSGLGYSLIRNIKEFWFEKGTIRTARKKEYDDILDKYENHGIVAVINAMHTHAMQSKVLKGEWIIYKECRGIKYFLCLATHSEGDSNIFEHKIKLCLDEFPQLKNNEC